MAAVLVGGLIVIWLGLSGSRAVLVQLGVRLHGPARVVAPLVPALIETPLFLLTIPAGDVLPEHQRWPVAVVLTLASWLISAIIAGWVARQRPVIEG